MVCNNAKTTLTPANYEKKEKEEKERRRESRRTTFFLFLSLSPHLLFCGSHIALHWLSFFSPPSHYLAIYLPTNLPYLDWGTKRKARRESKEREREARRERQGEKPCLTSFILNVRIFLLPISFLLVSLTLSPGAPFTFSHFLSLFL